MLKKFIFSFRYKRIWIPISYIWHSFHKFIYFNIFNKELKYQFKRNKKINPFKIETPNKKYIDFTQELYSFLLSENLLSNKKNELLKSTSKTSYMTDLFPDLNLELKSKLFEYAISDKDIQSYLQSYFGFKPRLHDIIIIYSIYKKGLGEEGSKLWHRDTIDTDFRQMKIFIPVTKITNTNGPFYFLKNKELAKDNIAIKEMQGKAWIGGRVSNDWIKKLKGEIQSTENFEPGSKIYFDSRRVYHKGGFSSADDRIMIQFRYKSNSYSCDDPKDFSKEIEWLIKRKDKNLTKYIDDYLYANKLFFNMNSANKLIRKIVFKLTPIFTYYRKI